MGWLWLAGMLFPGFLLVFFAYPHARRSWKMDLGSLRALLLFVCVYQATLLVSAVNALLHGGWWEPVLFATVTWIVRWPQQLRERKRAAQRAQAAPRNMTSP